MPDILFRKADLSDLESVRQLFARAVLHMRKLGIDQWDEKYPNRSILCRDIEAGEMYLGCREDRVVSAVVLNEWQDPEYAEVGWKLSGKPCVLHRLCVCPDAQKQGIARATVAFFEETARELQYGCIRLDTFSGNEAALALYRSLGYRYAGDVTFTKGLFHCFEKPLG